MPHLPRDQCWAHLTDCVYSKPLGDPAEPVSLLESIQQLLVGQLHAVDLFSAIFAEQNRMHTLVAPYRLVGTFQICIGLHFVNECDAAHVLNSKMAITDTVSPRCSVWRHMALEHHAGRLSCSGIHRTLVLSQAL